MPPQASLCVSVGLFALALPLLGQTPQLVRETEFNGHGAYAQDLGLLTADGVRLLGEFSRTDSDLFRFRTSAEGTFWTQSLGGTTAFTLFAYPLSSRSLERIREDSVDRGQSALGTVLPAGEYKLALGTQSGAARYDLRFWWTPKTLPSTRPGRSLPLTFPGRHLVRIDVPSEGRTNLKIDGSSAALMPQVRLLNQSMETITTLWSSAPGDAGFAGDLPAGTYYALLESRFSDSVTLRHTAQPRALWSLACAGQFEVTSTGKFHEVATLKFNLAASQEVFVQAIPTFGNASMASRLQLLDDTLTPILSNSRSANRRGSVISGTLPAGKYYLIAQSLFVGRYTIASRCTPPNARPIPIGHSTHTIEPDSHATFRIQHSNPTRVAIRVAGSESPVTCLVDDQGRVISRGWSAAASARVDTRRAYLIVRNASAKRGSTTLTYEPSLARRADNRIRTTGIVGNQWVLIASTRGQAPSSPLPWLSGSLLVDLGGALVTAPIAIPATGKRDFSFAPAARGRVPPSH